MNSNLNKKINRTEMYEQQLGTKTNKQNRTAMHEQQLGSTNRLNRKKINYSKFEQQQINEIGQKFMNSNLEFF